MSSIDKADVLVVSGGILGITSALIALATPYIFLSLIICIVGLACVLSSFYIN